MRRFPHLNLGVSHAMLRTVIIPTAATLIILATLVAAVLHVSTSRSDSLAYERQKKLVEIAVAQSITAVANDQEASTYWDDAVLRTRERPLDMEWLDSNLGVWFHTYYKHDETYLLGPDNAPVYAMQSGARVQPSAFSRVSKQSLNLVVKLRKALLSSSIAPGNSGAQTVGESEITLVDGRPAIVSLKPIVSETGEIAQAPGSEYLHVSVRYLDSSFLETLSEMYAIDDADFHWAPQGNAWLPVTAGDGRTLGYFTWSPFAPGEDVEDQMQPVLLVALIIIGILTSLLLLRIRRSRMDLEASRAQAQHLAFHDSLTGLPNRALFEDRLEHALGRRDSDVAVLMLDLDRFKNVNDTLGHQAGDALIREFGLRLAALIRDGDTISRLGGDEFAIIVEDADTLLVRQLAERILADVSRPFDVIGSQLHIGVSVGVALSQDSRSEPMDMVRKADIALYQAKANGRNIYCLFQPYMDASVQLRSALEDELREALATGKGLRVQYQPQVGADGKIIGLEALVRWHNPTRGLISPEQFVPVAEDSGLIVPLGEWVLRQACLVARRWPGLFVAVNLSPVQFRAPKFFDSLMSIVQATGADPRSIQLEVTERVLLDHDDNVRNILLKLREAGFSIVLDDFGTGYSSLSYLRDFEVDKIKIDRSFIQHLGDAADSAEIVAAVLALGRALGLAVAAEGVETAEQRKILKAIGCKEMQGFYFSRPVSSDKLGELFGSPGIGSAAA